MATVDSNTTAPAYTALKSGSTVGFGQTFTVVDTCNLGNIITKFQKQGNPSGVITISLYAITGTYGTTAIPTGNALSISDSIDVGGISSGVISFNFSGAQRIQLTNGYYALFVDGSNLTTDASNYISIYVSVSDVHNGNRFYKTTNWIATTNDLYFTVNSILIYTLTSDIQNFVFSGIDPVIISSRKILVFVKTFSLATINTLFLKTLHLILSVKTFSLTTYSTILAKTRLLIINVKNFSLNGVNSILTSKITTHMRGGVKWPLADREYDEQGRSRQRHWIIVGKDITHVDTK